MASIPINGSPRFTDTDTNSVDGTSGDWQFELGDNNLYAVSYTHLTLPTILRV